MSTHYIQGWGRKVERHESIPFYSWTCEEYLSFVTHLWRRSEGGVPSGRKSERKNTFAVCGEYLKWAINILLPLSSPNFAPHFADPSDAMRRHCSRPWLVFVVIVIINAVSFPLGAITTLQSSLLSLSVAIALLLACSLSGPSIKATLDKTIN